MITSSANPQIKNVMNLLKKASARREQGLFVVEGDRIVREVPTDRIEKIYMSESYATARKKKVEFPVCEIVNDKVFQFMADTRNPQGILALVKITADRFGAGNYGRANDPAADCGQKNPNPVYLILERIQDPGNLGTILRTAEGAGVTAVILSADTADIYNPKVVRSTMGSLFRVPFYYTENLAATIGELKAQGVKACAAHLAGDHDFYEEDYTGPTAFLIGNEGNGLTEETAALADCKVLIPMEGKLESLNAAVSAALFMYETMRQRRK